MSSVPFKYDAFVSYSHDDRSWVADWLVPALERAGLKLCVDADDFAPGALSIVEMERAVVESARTILVLTPAYVKSQWTTFEHSLAQTSDPAALGRRVIPVLRGKCQPPPRLAALVHLDFTTPGSSKRNLPRLVAAVGRSAPPRPGEESSAILESVEAKRFLRYVEERYKYLEFRGMGITDRVALRLPLEDMYVPLAARVEIPEGETWSRELRVAGRKATADEVGAIGERVSEPRPVAELLREKNGVVVLGDPGAGKTTFLKHIALQLASGRAGDLGIDARLPMILPLSAYANALASDDVSLGEFIARYYRDLVGSEAGELVERTLTAGCALLLLDGLDEVHEAHTRRTVVDRVFDFLTYHRQAGNKFALTSRIVGYRDVRRSLEWVAECTLVDFGDGEIETFVERWTGAIERAARGDTAFAREQAAEQREQLQQAIRVNPGVHALAANPLLLTILALMLRQGVSLPERRVDLYEKYVETLLVNWNMVRGLGRGAARRVDLGSTMKVLAPLALWMHETSPGAGLVKRAHLRRELHAIFERLGTPDPERRADEFLADVRDYSGLLVERGAGEYGFLHLTFQEYLAAVAIGQMGQRNVDEVVRVLGTRVGDPAWREVVLLTIGYLGIVQKRDEAAGEVVEALVSQAPGPPGHAAVLAGEAVADAVEAVTAQARETVVRALLATMRDTGDVSASTRVSAGNVLGSLGDSRFLATAWYLPDDRTLGFDKVAAGTFLMGSDPERDTNAGEDEQPQHRVNLREFYIARYPVTVAQYRAFVEASGFVPENPDCLRGIANHPVVWVSWYEALKYCGWLTETLQGWRDAPAAVRSWLAATLQGDHGWRVTLPSEAEWEKAARGVDEWIYPWKGDFDPDRANTVESRIRRTSAVGAFPGGASPCGALDMSGNVFEWTRSLRTNPKTGKDFKYPYQADDAAREELTADKISRVVRGGSFHYYDLCARAAYRSSGGDPDSRGASLGFRVVVACLRC